MARAGGKIASNVAYSAYKRGRSGLPPRKGLSFSFPDCPPSFSVVIAEVGTIQSEILRLGEGATRMNLGGGKYDATPLIRLCAYNSWLQSSKEKIKVEIRLKYQSLTGPSYVLQQNVGAEAEAWIDTIAVEVNSGVTRIKNTFDECLRTARQQENVPLVHKAFEERLSLCSVDPNTFKLIDPSTTNLVLD